MYEWQKLTEEQKRIVLAGRRKNQRPWHGPPHFDSADPHTFHISAACYKHLPLVGITLSRLESFESRLIETLSSNEQILHAWCVLPNHWHALVHTGSLKETIKRIGRLHGRTSFLWNNADGTRRRKCWHRCAGRRIRSDRHFHVARNYIHYNPVKHGYVNTWEKWQYSSAADFINETGRELALKQWHEYPVLDMGAGWDD